MAEHGKIDKPGWAALDKVSLVRSECMFQPPEAFPSTPAPTMTSTVPPEDDVFCTFQEDVCGFEIQSSSEEFKLERTKASDAEEIGTDHHSNSDGFFLFAKQKSLIPEEVWTYIAIPEEVGPHGEHAIECFNFWFFIDGFLVRFYLKDC